MMSLPCIHSSDSCVSNDSHKAPGVGDELLSDLFRTRNFGEIEGFQQLVVKRTFLHAPRKHWYEDDGEEQPLRRRSSSFSEGCASEHEQCMKAIAAISGVDSDMASMSTEGSFADHDVQVEVGCPNVPEAQLYESDEYQKGYTIGCLEMTATRLHVEALQVEAEAFRIRAAAFEAEAFRIRAAAQKVEEEAFSRETDAHLQAAKKACPAGAGKAKGALDNQSHRKTSPTDTTLSTNSFENWPTLTAACKKKKKPLAAKKEDAFATSLDCVVCN